MYSKKTRPTNQTIDQIFDEYSWELDQYLKSFVRKFGYLPKEPTSMEYNFSPEEVKEMSRAFWNDPHINMLDSLTYTLQEVMRKL